MDETQGNFFMRKWTIAAAALAAAITGTATANAQPPVAPRGAPEAAVARAGTFSVKLTLQKKTTAIPNNVVPTCFTQFYGWNGQTQTWNEEIIGVFADGSGVNKTCNVSVAYSWPSVESAVPVNVRVWVQLGKEPYPTTVSASVDVPARKSLQEFTIPLPANNATTEVKRTLVY
jgi:hypothetical protein